jgi:uncharacterized protein (DUF983 family)
VSQGSPRRAVRLRIARRVTRGRCPQCGVGALFVGYARLAHACVRCGLVFRREAGAQTGSMYLTAVAGELCAAALVLLFWWLFDWRPALFVAVTAPLVLAFCLLFLPLAQALWVGVEYATDLEGGEPWAELRE